MYKWWKILIELSWGRKILTILRNVHLKIRIWVHFNLFYPMISKPWKLFSGEKYRLYCLSEKKYQLNCHGGEKCRSNEGMSTPKQKFESILIFPIQCLNFDSNRWNYFSGEKYRLNYLSDKKYQLNCRGGEKCQPNSGISTLK